MGSFEIFVLQYEFNLVALLNNYCVLICNFFNQLNKTLFLHSYVRQMLISERWCKFVILLTAVVLFEETRIFRLAHKQQHFVNPTLYFYYH